LQAKRNTELSTIQPVEADPPKAFTGAVSTTLSSLMTRAEGTVVVRQQINEWCTETYTRAIAWCLWIFADDPKMSVPDICEWLDELGVAAPKMKNWNDCYRKDRKHKAKIEKMVSDQRTNLRQKGMRFNH
jgi:hypothetical protein